jgi:hypothetical protein
MICRTAKYGARLSLIAENQVVTLSRHLATFKGLEPFLSRPSLVILFAAKGDKSGIRVFRLFLAPNPVPPQTFKIVDIPTRRYPPGFLKGLRHQHGKTGVAIENTVFPGSEGDYIAFHGHAVIRQADTKLLAISTMLAGQFVYTPFYGLPRWSQGLGRDAARVNDCRLYCTNNEQRLGARLTADRAAQAVRRRS